MADELLPNFVEEHMTTLNKGACLLAGILAFSLMGMAQDHNETEVVNRLNNATAVFQEMAPQIPPNLLRSAQCIAVIPSMKKGAFIIGASHGAGFASCRTASGWSAPAPISISGGSIGLQAGGQTTDIVLLFMTPKARNELLTGSFKMGVGTSVQAGPTGAGAQTGVADIYTYTRTNGVFAGAEVSGSQLSQDSDATTALYGTSTAQPAILEGRVPTPPSARQFIATLDRYSGQA